MRQRLRKNLFLMTGSFALTIVLFLAFSACLDVVHKLLPSVSDFTPDITIASEDESNSIDRSLLEDISEISGVESAFGMMLAIDYPVEINGNAGKIDLFSYGDFMLDSFKESMISGDLSSVYGASDYVMAVYNDAGHLNVGDKIKIGNHEVEVACVASEGVGSVSGATVVVCSEETYRNLTGEQDYATVSIITKSDISESEVEQIRDLFDGYQFSDDREEKNDVFWLLLGIPNCGIRFPGNHFSDNHVEYYEQYFNECFCKGEAIRCDACCWDGEQAGYKDDNGRGSNIRCLRYNCRNCPWVDTSLFDLCEDCH